jgi:hypothetical protein
MELGSVTLKINNQQRDSKVTVSSEITGFNLKFKSRFKVTVSNPGLNMNIRVTGMIR